MTSAQQDLRVLALASGDVAHQPVLRTKHAAFLEALSRRVQLAAVLDTRLTGWLRLAAALRTFHPSRVRWQERFYQHPEVFRARSRRLARQLRQWRDQVDVVLQLSTLFDAAWGEPVLPVVQYCDYTARLAARDRVDYRSPFTEAERTDLFELEARSYQRSAYIYTWSRRVRESLLEDYGLAPERVIAIGGGVGLALPAGRRRPAEAAPTALFIGSDFRRKGGDVLLRAFALARQQTPAARLEVITRDVIPADLPLAGVTVHPPRWDRELVLDRLAAVDVLVLPSRLETWGDVLLEAMAYSLPCIGVSGLSMEEIVVPENTGLLVPPEDPQALADALSRVFANPELSQTWGRAGRQRLEQLFTWPQVIERLLPGLAQAARQTPAGAPA